MKTFHHPLLLGALASLSLLFGNVWADDAVEIKQHWSPGKSYSFTTTLTQELSFELGGVKTQQKLTNTTDMTSRVESEGGKQHLIVRYDRIAMTMARGSQTMKYDSSNPDDANSPLAASFGTLAGTDFKVLLNENGQPVDVENWDELVAASKNAGEKRVMSREAILQAMKGGMLQAMPGHPVKPGDQWPFDVSIDMPAIGKISVNGNMALRSVGMHDGARCAEIGSDARLSLQQKEKGNNDASNPLAAMKMKIAESAMTGNTWFDLSLGKVRDAEIHQEMTMTMNDPTDATRTVTMPIKQVIHIKLNKVEDTK